MSSPKLVLIVDPSHAASARRSAIARIASEEGLQAVSEAGGAPVVGIIGHNPDLRRLLSEGVVMGAPVVHYRGTDFPPHGARGHYRFPHKIDGDGAGIVAATQQLRMVLRWFRDGGAPPEFILLPSADLVEPLLPLAVLLDGYPAWVAGSAGGGDWFRPAIEATLSATTPTGHAVGSAEYWEALHESAVVVERLRKIIGDNRLPEGLRGAIKRAGNEGKTSADDIYMWACERVRAAWDRLAVAFAQDAEAEVPRGEELRRLVDDASDGFHVIAAGHL